MGVDPVSIGLIVGAVGAGTSLLGNSKMQKAQKQETAASQRAEAARFKQMELSAAREKRQIIRQGALARAQSQSTATAQGAFSGSGEAGAMAQIAGQTALGIGENRQALGLGADIFAANRDIATARGNQATAQGITQFGNALVQNAGTIGTVGTQVASYAGFGPNPWRTTTTRY